MSTVMVVDDEERIRTLITRSLASEGHRVVSANDGVNALDRLATEDIDLVLLCLLYTSPSPRDRQKSRMPSSA